MYRDVQGDLTGAQQTSQKLFDGVAQIDGIQTKLSKAGGALAAATTALIDKVQAGPDESLVKLAMKLDSQLMMMRVVSMRAQLLTNVDSMPALADYGCQDHGEHRGDRCCRPGRCSPARRSAQSRSGGLPQDRGGRRRHPAPSPRSLRQPDRAADREDAGEDADLARSSAAGLQRRQGRGRVLDQTPPFSIRRSSADWCCWSAP